MSILVPCSVIVFGVAITLVNSFGFSATPVEHKSQPPYLPFYRLLGPPPPSALPPGCFQYPCSLGPNQWPPNQRSMPVHCVFHSVVPGPPGPPGPPGLPGPAAAGNVIKSEQELAPSSVSSSTTTSTTTEKSLDPNVYPSSVDLLGESDLNTESRSFLGMNL